MATTPGHELERQQHDEQRQNLRQRRHHVATVAECMEFAQVAVERLQRDQRVTEVDRSEGQTGELAAVLVGENLRERRERQ